MPGMYQNVSRRRLLTDKVGFVIVATNSFLLRTRSIISYLLIMGVPTIPIIWWLFVSNVIVRNLGKNIISSCGPIKVREQDYNLQHCQYMVVQFGEISVLV
jgi:ABC-type lipoprotein release transport system permease subunit